MHTAKDFVDKNVKMAPTFTSKKKSGDHSGSPNKDFLPAKMEKSLEK